MSHIQESAQTSAQSPLASSSSLDGLLRAWLALEDQLAPLHREYHDQSQQSAPSSREAAQAAHRPTPQPASFQSNRAPSREPASLAQSLNPGAPQRQPLNLWSRDGFTPIPRSMALSEDAPPPKRDGRGDHHSSPNLSVQSASNDAQLMSEPLPAHAALGNSYESLPDPSASDQELETFTTVAERLMRAQERSESERREPEDSSRPSPLDELYESSQSLLPPTSLVSRARMGDSDETTDISGYYVAPEPLRAQSKTPWGKMILVSLLSIGIGALIAYGALGKLW